MKGGCRSPWVPPTSPAGAGGGLPARGPVSALPRPWPGGAQRDGPCLRPRPIDAKMVNPRGSRGVLHPPDLWHFLPSGLLGPGAPTRQPHPRLWTGQLRHRVTEFKFSELFSVLGVFMLPAGPEPTSTEGEASSMLTVSMDVLKQPRRDEWASRTWSVHTADWYSGLEKKEIQTQGATQVNPEDIVFRERSPSQRDEYPWI